MDWGKFGTGAAKGATMGMAAGPYGALLGGAIGGLGGLFSGDETPPQYQPNESSFQMPQGVPGWMSGMSEYQYPMADMPTNDANTGLARWMQDESRGLGADVLSNMRSRAMGNDLSATRQARLDREAAQRAYASQAATAMGRGGFNPATYRGAQQMYGGAEQAIAGRAALAAGEERNAAQGLFMQASQAQRAQDLGLMDRELKLEQQRQQYAIWAKELKAKYMQMGLNDKYATQKALMDLEQLKASQGSDAQKIALEKWKSGQDWWQRMMTGGMKAGAGALAAWGLGGSDKQGSSDSGDDSGDDGGLGSSSPFKWDPTSDVHAKTDVRSGSADVQRFLDMLGSPSAYEYKDPSAPGRSPGRQLGVMAQDAQRSALGSRMVRRGPDGMLQIDAQTAVPLLLASVAHLNQQITAMRPKPSPLGPGESASPSTMSESDQAAVNRERGSNRFLQRPLPENPFSGTDEERLVLNANMERGLPDPRGGYVRLANAAANGPGVWAFGAGDLIPHPGAGAPAWHVR